MNFLSPTTLTAAAIATAALGLYGLLPPRRGAARVLGAMLAVASLGIFSALMLAQAPVIWNTGEVLFWVQAAVLLVSAGAAVTSRQPVYCALWFGLSLLATAALFLFAGAQFLAVATIVVYVGAILVTLLFVLMLASPTASGAADRLTWEPLLNATAASILVGALSVAVARVPAQLDQAPVASKARAAGILGEDHVARLGAEMFGKHLIAVEVAGALLLVALIGATAIVAKPQKQAGALPAGSPSDPRSAFDPKPVPEVR